MAVHLRWDKIDLPFAFVEFGDAAHVATALALQSTEVGGCKLLIKERTSKGTGVGKGSRAVGGTGGNGADW